MLNFPRQLPRNPRAALAIVLIAISFIAAFAISQEAHRSIQVWSATHPLLVGQSITSSDVKLSRVLLPENASHYLASSADIFNLKVQSQVGVGELIPVTALTKQIGVSHMQSLPVRVARSDLPTDLQVGQRVDLYSVATSATQSTTDPVIAALGLTVEAIDQKSKDLGGDIGIVLSISKSSVLSVVRAIAYSRVVVVRDAI
ncbi:MAG: hypothetical protein WCK62_00180 [Actinomycetes bacterium]